MWTVILYPYCGPSRKLGEFNRVDDALHLIDRKQDRCRSLGGSVTRLDGTRWELRHTDAGGNLARGGVLCLTKLASDGGNQMKWKSPDKVKVVTTVTNVTTTLDREDLELALLSYLGMEGGVVEFHVSECSEIDGCTVTETSVEEVAREVL